MAKKDKKIEIKEKESSASMLVQKFKENPLLYTGSVIILLLVVVTFVGGDLLSGVRGGGADLTFGYYDKAPISWIPGNTFANNQEQTQRYYQSQGVDVNNFNNSTQIWRQAFEATVMQTAILQIMKRSNYTAPVSTVDREVAGLPYFQENGRFSSALYNQMSESSRLTLWNQVRDELAMEKFYTDFYYGLTIPQAEADFIGKMSSVMRTFQMVALNVENYPEEEYRSYADANADIFGTIHLSKITISSSEREAVRVLDSIRNGTQTFEDAARTQSQDTYADKGGDMGIQYYYDLQGELSNSTNRDMILSLSRGAISDVIQNGSEWAFYRVEERLVSANFNDELTMERVRSYLRNFDRGRMEDWAISQARDFISDAEASGFNSAASWRNLNINTFGPIPLNYGSVDLFPSLESFAVSALTAQDLQSLSINENFWRIAFSTQLNTPSEPLVQGDYVIVLFPFEQQDGENWQNTASIYSSYWLNSKTEQILRYYFLNNERMDDRFWEAYFRYFMPL